MTILHTKAEEVAMNLSILVLATAGLVSAGDDKDAAKELKRLEGNWQMVDGEIGGSVDTRAEKMRLIIEDGVGTTYYGTTRKEVFKLSLDPGADPKTINLQLVPASAGKVALGIYRLSEDGNKLELCYGYVGKKRPTLFTTKPGVGSGNLYQVYKREGAGGKTTDTTKTDKGDLKKLTGSWQMVEMELEGRTDDRAAKKKIVIDDNKLSFYYDEREVSADRFTLDEGADPRAIELKGIRGSGAGRTKLGIYRLSEDGNKLEICLSQAGDRRPSNFTTKPGVGKGSILYVLERKKD
jgi:uncharacterized protein (TIGR03067 family)